jgi:hypothetical protein
VNNRTGCEHKAPPPEEIVHKGPAICVTCGFKERLFQNERWWGFDINGNVLKDKISDSGFFCRECGEKGLLVADGDGDYYAGPSYYCDSCNSMFTMG